MAAVEKKTRVLIVDDSAFMRKVLEEIIRTDSRLEVVGQAKDGREAVTLAQTLQPDVMTMDINMPRMNGYELMSHLRQDPATRRIPVLVVTSRAGAKHRERAMKEGAASFLTKPVQEEQLLAVVDELMNSAARQRRPAAPALDLA